MKPEMRGGKEHSRDNHRACSRTPLNLAVTLYSRSGSAVDGKLIDISFGGAYIETSPNSVHVEEPVTLAMLLRDRGQEQLFSMSAVVVRKGSGGAGLMFDEYDADTVYCLRRVYRMALD